MIPFQTLSDKIPDPNWLSASNVYSNTVANMMQTYLNSLASTFGAASFGQVGFTGVGLVPAQNPMMPFFANQLTQQHSCNLPVTKPEENDSPKVKNENFQTTDGVLNLSLQNKTSTAKSNGSQEVKSECNVKENKTKNLQQVKNEPENTMNAAEFSEKLTKIVNGTFLWTAQLPAFQMLSLQDQKLLTQASWKEILLLNLAQNLTGDEVSKGFYAQDQSPKKSDENDLASMLRKIQSVELDSTEFVFLKTIAVFKPEILGLKDPKVVEVLQDQCQVILNEYVKRQHPSSPTRFGKHLLLMSSIKSLREDVIVTQLKLSMQFKGNHFDLIKPTIESN